MKLEQSLDALEDDLEREKRLKLEQDKQRKKVENDLRAVEESFNVVERSKSELEDVICRKNKELAALVEKLEDEQRLVAKSSKQIKECSVSGESDIEYYSTINYFLQMHNSSKILTFLLPFYLRVESRNLKSRFNLRRFIAPNWRDRNVIWDKSWRKYR